MSKADLFNLHNVLMTMEDAAVDPEKDKYIEGTWKLISKQCIDVEFLLLKKQAPGGQGAHCISVLQCRPFTKTYYHDDVPQH